MTRKAFLFFFFIYFFFSSHRLAAGTKVSPVASWPFGTLLHVMPIVVATVQASYDTFLIFLLHAIRRSTLACALSLASNTQADHIKADQISAAFLHFMIRRKSSLPPTPFFFFFFPFFPSNLRFRQTICELQVPIPQQS